MQDRKGQVGCIALQLPILSQEGLFLIWDFFLSPQFGSFGEQSERISGGNDC